MHPRLYTEHLIDNGGWSLEAEQREFDRLNVLRGKREETERRIRREKKVRLLPEPGDKHE